MPKDLRMLTFTPVSFLNKTFSQIKINPYNKEYELLMMDRNSNLQKSN